MGTEYYMFNLEKGEKFELGRGNWEIIKGPNPGSEEFKELVVDVLMNRGSDLQFARRFANALSEWCSTRTPVSMSSDAVFDEEEHHDLLVTGSIHEFPIPSHQEVREKLEAFAISIRKEMGFDEVQILASIEEPCELEIEDCESVCWEYEAESGVSNRASGYRRK